MFVINMALSHENIDELIQLSHEYKVSESKLFSSRLSIPSESDITKSYCRS
jgi:hypothetical protein